MNKKIFKQKITEFHSKLIPDNIIKRTLQVKLTSRDVVSITGSRRSGKTYFMYAMIQELLSEKIPKELIVYIDFEDERLNLNRNSLQEIIEAYEELYPEIDLQKVFFFFDEIQNVDGWEKFIRRLHNNVSRNIVITGSNSKSLGREIDTALRGRVLNYEIYPFSFREFKKFRINKNKKNVELLHEEYLKIGGYPDVINDDSNRDKRLQQYFNTMIYRDMIERYAIKDELLLKYFVKRSVESLSSEFSINQIYNDLKQQYKSVDKHMLYNYAEYAESIYLMFILLKYDSSFKRQHLGNKKVYFIDNGIVNSISFSFTQNQNLTKLLENEVFLHLKRADFDISYYKNIKTQKECDFIARARNKEQLAIQVCYNLHSDNWEREVNGLLSVREELGIKEGYILTRNQEYKRREKGMYINVIPTYKFLLNFLDV